MFKVGDKIRRITWPFERKGMLVGCVYTVEAVTSFGLKLRGIPDHWHHSNFELVTEEYKKFGNLKIEDKLSLIESYLRNNQLEVSEDGWKWNKFKLKAQSQETVFDDSKYYRLHGNSETIKKIEEIESQMVELTNKLNNLKKEL